MPRVVVPSLKVTVPVGVPLPGAAALDRGREGHRLAEDRRVGRGDVSARGRRVLVDRLGQRGGGAGGEVAVAAVDGGDRCAIPTASVVVVKVAVPSR